MLAKLYREVPAAKPQAEKAKAVLIFPSVVKGGLVVCGRYDDGTLRTGGKSVAYDKTTAVTFVPTKDDEPISFVAPENTRTAH